MGLRPGAPANIRESLVNTHRPGWWDGAQVQCQGHDDEAVESQKLRIADVVCGADSSWERFTAAGRQFVGSKRAATRGVDQRH